MKGSTFKRCPCGTVRDAQGNRINCPKRHGTWYYAHELPPGPDGKRQQSRVGGFATEREAREALNEALNELRRGTYRFRSKQTVGDYLRHWLDSKTTLRATTRRSYEEAINLYIAPGIGHIRLIDLVPRRHRGALPGHAAARPRGAGTTVADAAAADQGPHGARLQAAQRRPDQACPRGADVGAEHRDEAAAHLLQPGPARRGAARASTQGRRLDRRADRVVEAHRDTSGSRRLDR